MAHQDENGRAKREPTPGGATGGGGIGADAVTPESPGNDQGGIVGSGAAWHHEAGSAAGESANEFAGNKPTQSGIPKPGLSQPGVMGDWTEEQNLGQPGNPDARIGKDEVDAAFAGDKPQGDKSRPDYPDELVAPDDGEKR
jgi:hypothetical protein